MDSKLKVVNVFHQPNCLQNEHLPVASSFKISL